MRCTAQTYHRYTHQERLARGGRIRIRKSVKRDVDIIVDFEMVEGRWSERKQLQPVFCYPMGFELTYKLRLHVV